MAQVITNVYEAADAQDLSADITLANAPTIVVGQAHRLRLQADITSPAASTEGVWRLWVSDVDVTASYKRAGLFDADLATELSNIAPQGDAATVDAEALVENIQAKYARLVYDRTAGGGSSTLLVLTAVGEN